MAETLFNLTFPSEHQYVIIDTQSIENKVQTRSLAYLPLSFMITYDNDAKINSSPTLTLLINPSSMNVSKSKKVNVNFTRQGNIVEEWGENQDVLTFDGRIGAYYIINAGNINKNVKTVNEVDTTLDSTLVGGINRYHRTKSLSFKNLYHLLLLFRNNGAIYERTIKGTEKTPGDRLIKRAGLPFINRRTPEIVENAKNRISKLGKVLLNYDGQTYQGAFDDFSITEIAEKPFSLDYSFTFTVQRRYESDYRSFNHYAQTTIEFDDISSNPSQIRRVIKSGLATVTEAREQEKATLDGNSTFVNPNDLITVDTSRQDMVNNVSINYFRELERRNLKVTPIQRANIKSHINQMTSTNYKEANQGLNNLRSETNQIYRDNGSDPNTAAVEADSLANSQGLTPLQSKKRKVT